ncbi:hypothetical protein [Novosphingobium resinovorum]|uniref:hypothetical protein n=1 Tax=Novosphingobium resinovorum TaxID=158500 RepID=UPI002ED2F532|nr:hypothetical protein [Novosphingobium resinovorum]
MTLPAMERAAMLVRYASFPSRRGPLSALRPSPTTRVWSAAAALHRDAPHHERHWRQHDWGQRHALALLWQKFEMRD